MRFLKFNPVNVNRLFLPAPVALNRILGIVRIILGLLLIYHGQEVFHSDIMATYMTWDTFQSSMAKFMVYAGKSTELLAGILLLMGFLTRVGAILIIGTFCYITFFVGGGRFWYEDQHPFMFALFGLLFVFTGPGAWSLDSIVFGKKDPS